MALEKRFETVERALYQCTQKPDQSNDSFLARADIMWSELLAKNLTMKEIQAYIILRGSQLSGDDKKRVLVESGAEADGALTQTRVNQAIRMLGSNFFQDYVGFRKAKTKTYDSQTLLADAVNSEEGDNDIYAAEADSLDDSSWLEHLTQEGDPDAILVSEYETALSETVQEDNELASCYNAYVEARHRLTERFKSRGFWPIKGKGKTGKGFGKGKKGSKKSLEQRILSSTCRLCGQRGHWKAECPQRFSHNPSSSSSTGGVPTASTSFVDLSQDQSLPLEFMQLPSVHESTIDEPPPQLSSIVLFGDVSNMSVTMGIINRLRNRNLRNRTQAPAPLHDVHKPTIVRDDKPTCTSGSQSCFDPPRTDLNHRKDLNAQSIDHAEPVCFASHSSFGVVDLGASKTVIGSKGVQELLEALHPEVKAKCYRTPCVINFRFGNQGMLASQWALVIPLNPSLHLKVAVVPGNTPFLLSNALLRTLGAVIDTRRSELWSHEHQFQIPLTLTNRGLFLLDINQLLSHMWPSLKADHCSCPKPKLVPRDNLSDTIVGVESKSRSFQQQLPLITEPSNDETTVTCHAIDDKSHDVPSNHTGELEVTGNSMDKHKCVPTSNLDQKTNTSLSSSPSCDFGVCCHGHVVGSFEEGSNRCCREVTAGHSSSGSRGGEDSLREETPGTILQRRMVGGSSLGTVVHRPLRVEQQQQSQEVLDVCGEKGSRTGTVGEYNSQDQWRVWDRKSTTGSPKAQRCTEGQEPWSTTNDSASRRGGPATSVDDYRTILMAGDHDLDFPEHLEPFCTGVTEKKKFQQLVHQYEQEYHALLNPRPCVKKESTDVLEVFCGPHSTLTTQSRHLGLKASRFTLSDGDLHTADGRRELFCRVIDMDPNNLWYSPECRPWSAWSFLNGSLSRDAWTRLYADRLKGLEQVALGLVLFRIQVSRHHHMHWEQPSRSLMFQLPHMQEVFAYTKMAEFDLCNVAQYHDPVSRKPIKKGLCVCTTSQKLFQLLHGRKCQRNHEHQAIEGTTMFQGQRISRSRFTEHYPRKFVRQIVKLWKQSGRSEAPFSDLILSTVLAETVEPAPKRPRIRAAPPVAPRWIEPAELPCLKRRKLDKQVDPTPSLVTEFQKVFQKIDEATPRVGKRVLQSDTEILQQMQKWFPEKKLVLGISCRGTDRLQPPPKELTPSEAPFRITVCSHRTTGKFFVTESWEEWQHLAQRQLIRSSGCPSRLSITVYARNPEISSGSSSPGVTTSDCLERVPEPDNRSTEISGGSQVETPHVKSREAVDISSEHHGPRFRALSSLERQAIVKCHKNLGHPSADRLKFLMKQQSFRPEMIEAIDDFKCSLCAEMKGPQLSRPAAFREPLDFNEHISMDGIVWENKQGTSFHFYHVVDHACHQFPCSWHCPKSHYRSGTAVPLHTMVILGRTPDGFNG